MLQTSHPPDPTGAGGEVRAVFTLKGKRRSAFPGRIIGFAGKELRTLYFSSRRLKADRKNDWRKKAGHAVAINLPPGAVPICVLPPYA